MRLSCQGEIVMLEHNNRGKKYWTEMEEAEHFDCPEMAAYSP